MAIRLRDAVVVLFAVAVGFGIALVPHLLNDSGGEGIASPTKANPRVQLSTLADVRVAKPLPPATADPASVEPPAAPADTPVAAVTGFLDAEAAGDFAASYGGLSAPDRLRAGSRSEWTTAHAQLPTIRGFTLGETRFAPDRSEIDAEVELRPALDTIVGLVPARAHAVWIAVAEDGGWRVDFDNSSLVPEYAPDAAAVDAATSWISARVECRRAPHYRDGLLGVPALAADLCGARGQVASEPRHRCAPGPASSRSSPRSAPKCSRGPASSRCTSPSPTSVVLAPVGDRWVVVGASRIVTGWLTVSGPGTRRECAAVRRRPRTSPAHHCTRRVPPTFPRR